MNYMRGSKGPEVTKIQARLISLGYALPMYGADGDFGGETVQAVSNFQRDNNLTMDGVVGDSTWDKLFSASAMVQATIPEDSYMVTEKATANKSVYGGGIFSKIYSKKNMMYAGVGIALYLVFKNMKKKRRA